MQRTGANRYLPSVVMSESMSVSVHEGVVSAGGGVVVSTVGGGVVVSTVGGGVVVSTVGGGVVVSTVG